MNDVWPLLRRHTQLLVQEVALGYAWITLLPVWPAGAVLAVLTFYDPLAGAAGVMGALSAWLAARMAGAGTAERPVAVFNGLLCGLFVAHVWVFGPSVVALTLMGGVFAGWLSVVLGRLVWSSVQLPILSIPFALVSVLTTAAGASLSTLVFRPYLAPPEVWGGVADLFFSAFGALYFMPNPGVGMAVLAVLLLFSRYYFLLAVLGYAAANTWLTLMGSAPEHLAGTAWDSNAILAALLVGGLFATPSWLTAAHAILAAVLAAWLSLSIGRIFNAVQLAPFSIPFVLAAWLVLYAGVRNTRMAGLFSILHPDLPERSFARTQLATARVGSPGSVPLALPYRGVWVVSQGFSGAHTHRGPWRHALDFIVVQAGKSFTQRGSRLEDFYAYNLPVLSPAYGQVWRTVNDVPDNAPGSINLKANWGNCVVIRLSTGQFVLVAHLKPGSVAVHPGTWVKPYDLLGLCGNSGRSPQPHIHLHVQTTDEPGSPTVPFHLSSVMVASPNAAAHYKLAVVPQELCSVSSALEGDVRPLYLLAGRGLAYTVTDSAHGTDAASTQWRIWAQIDEQSRMVLVSSRGARCVVESTWAVFSCFDRNPVADEMFDFWLLACGYTPVSTQVHAWVDTHVLSSGLPTRMARLTAALFWPWATFAKGNYQRAWNPPKQCWTQVAEHRQNGTGITVRVKANISPQLGCSALHATVGDRQVLLKASRAFQLADLGVPSWDEALKLPLSLTSFS